MKNKSNFHAKIAQEKGKQWKKIINNLLIKARDNISNNVDKQTELNYRKALDESEEHKILKLLTRSL